MCIRDRFSSFCLWCPLSTTWPPSFQPHWVRTLPRPATPQARISGSPRRLGLARRPPGALRSRPSLPMPRRRTPAPGASLCSRPVPRRAHHRLAHAAGAAPPPRGAQTVRRPLSLLPARLQALAPLRPRLAPLSSRPRAKRTPLLRWRPAQ
eukprot:10304152-Alexandrium_andersonii.AAC.1